MRHSLRALISGLLIGACFCNAATAESGSRWWPFGKRDTEQAEPAASAADPGTKPPSSVEQPAAPPDSAEGEPDERWMIDSPLAKVSWPRLHLPKMPKPNLPRPQLWPKKSDVETARNAWVEQNPEAVQPSPLQAVTDGARRAADSSRAAWDKTVDAFTPRPTADGASSRIARRDARPPWWKRMFGAEQWQPEGPQTVTEWMAQERLDP